MNLNGQVETMAEFRDFVLNEFLGLRLSQKKRAASKN